MTGRGRGGPVFRGSRTDGRVRRLGGSAAVLAAVLVAVGAVGLSVSIISASTVAAVQVSASTVAAAQPLPIMMTVACVEAGAEGTFHLVNATEPEAVADQLPPQPEPSAALGGQRIRLIGTLDEFGVARHAGHKVWAKGLLVEDETERRLNLVSITHLSPDCE